MKKSKFLQQKFPEKVSKKDCENLKIKIESSFEGGNVEVYFVFDAEGNFVGHEVSMTSVDGTMSYSIQMKLVK